MCLKCPDRDSKKPDRHFRRVGTSRAPLIFGDHADCSRDPYTLAKRLYPLKKICAENRAPLIARHKNTVVVAVADYKNQIKRRFGHKRPKGLQLALQLSGPDRVTSQLCCTDQPACRTTEDLHDIVPRCNAHPLTYLVAIQRQTLMLSTPALALYPSTTNLFGSSFLPWVTGT